MNPGHAESSPRLHQFQIGKLGDDAQAPAQVARIKLLSLAVLPLIGLVENFGDDEFVLSLNDSEDNDTFADINVRTNGAAVASVTVPAGGRAVITLEPGMLTSLDSVYLQAEVDSDADAHGRLTLAHFNGAIENISEPFTV